MLPVSPEGRRTAASSIEGLASPFSAFGLISLVALFWGASGMMASISVGLEAALKVHRGCPAARAKPVDLVLVGVAGLLVLVSSASPPSPRSPGARRVAVRVAGGRARDESDRRLVSEGLQLVLIGS